MCRGIHRRFGYELFQVCRLWRRVKLIFYVASEKHLQTSGERDGQGRIAKSLCFLRPIHR